MLAVVGAVGWLLFASWIAVLYVLSGVASFEGVVCVVVDLTSTLTRQRQYRDEVGELTRSVFAPYAAPAAAPRALSQLEALARKVSVLEARSLRIEQHLSEETQTRERVIERLGQDVDSRGKTTAQLIGLATGIDRKPTVAAFGAALVALGIAFGLAASLLWIATSHVRV